MWVRSSAAGLAGRTGSRSRAAPIPPGWSRRWPRFGRGSRSARTVPEERPPQGRVLGLDLGAARIGVAVSDENRRVAVALGTVNTGAPKDLRSIAALVREQGVT